MATLPGMDGDVFFGDPEVEPDDEGLDDGPDNDDNDDDEIEVDVLAMLGFDPDDPDDEGGDDDDDDDDGITKSYDPLSSALRGALESTESDEERAAIIKSAWRDYP